MLVQQATGHRTRSLLASLRADGQVQLLLVLLLLRLGACQLQPARCVLAVSAGRALQQAGGH